MCGRYVLASDPSVLMTEFHVDTMTETPLAPDYNVAPTKKVALVLERDGTRVLETARWGFLPRWAKDAKIGNRMINARVETMAVKPAYRDAVRTRRCIVPADGYYEWYTPQANGPKQPFYIHRTDGRLLAMAGLYSWWRAGTDQPWVLTCTVITGAAPPALRHIHDRSPMFVPEDAQSAWLNPEESGAEAELTADASVEAIAVSTRVNNVRNNGPELIRPLPE